MAVDAGRLEAELLLRLDRFDKRLEAVDRRLARSAKAVESNNARIARSHAAIGRAATKTALAVKALISVYALGIGARFVRNQLQAVDALSKLSKATGFAADDLRRLQVGFELAGGRAETVDKGLLKFTQTFARLRVGFGELSSELERLDPAFLAQLKSTEDLDEAFRLIVDRMAQATSEQERMQIAFAAFGREEGKAFAEALRDGSVALDQMQTRLQRLGVGLNFDVLGPKVERMNDAFNVTRRVLSDRFLQGLLGTGEGLDNISEALDDETVRNLGEFAENFGKFTVWVGKFAFDKFQSIAILINSLSKGEGFVAAVESVGVNVATLEELETGLANVDQEIARLEQRLAAPVRLNVPKVQQARDRAVANRLRSELKEQEALRLKIVREIDARRKLQEEAPSDTSGAGRRIATATGNLLGTDDNQLNATERKIKAQRDALVTSQADFVASMRQASGEALTEAQRLSVQLATRLRTIGQSQFLSLDEKIEFQSAAIREALPAIGRAQEEALAAQEQQIAAFLETYGDQTVSTAQRAALAVQQALDQIPGLTPDQRAALEESARRRTERDEAVAQRGVERELLTLRATTEGEGIFGVSRAVEVEIAKAEAILEKSELDQRITEEFAGNPTRAAELLEQNSRLLEQRLGQIESVWDDRLGQIADFGEQVFADMVQGWVQGADVSFEGILQSFIAMLVKMEAEALAADVFGAIGAGSSGQGSQATSLTGQILGGVVGGLTGGLGGFLGFAEGGYITRKGEARKLPALASGGVAGQSSIAQLERATIEMPRGIGAKEIPALARGGLAQGSKVIQLEQAAASMSRGVEVLVGEAGPERILTPDAISQAMTLSGGDPARAASIAASIGERVTQPEIRFLEPGEAVVPDRKLGPFFRNLFPERRAADGGFVPLEGIRPADRSGGTVAAAGDIEVNFNLTQVGGPRMDVRNTRVERSGRRVNFYGELAVRDTRSGGPGAREAERTYGYRVRPREV